MAPPKRAIFSLNVDSNAEHFLERIEDHSKQGKGKVKVREHKEPFVGNTSLQLLTRPFEKEVQRSVERIVDGRVVKDTKITRENSQTRNEKRKKSVEERYDTSDL